MNELEKMLSGVLYDASDRELMEARKNARMLFEEFNSTSVTEGKKRKEIAEKLFGKCGRKLYIEPTFRCDYGFNIEFGDNIFINFDCVILDCARVKIGDNCLIAPQVGIYTAAHPTALEERLSGLEYAREVVIGNNCWIGGHSTICPGVRLGDNVIVAAGSVVTKSFGDNVIIGGNPAKIIREIEG